MTACLRGRHAVAPLPNGRSKHSGFRSPIEFNISSIQSSFAICVNRVLGAGVEPAHLAAPEPKSGVSAIPPPEQNL